MKRALFLLVLLPCFAAHSLQGQLLQELAFNETTHDFGSIKEVEGPVEYEFVFTNTGSNPITVTNVRASCGCTTPGWTKEEVAPGENGFVKARYDPKNRPGPFKKSLTITTNGTQESYVLFIEGQVEPRPRTIEDDFPQEIGALRVKHRAFNMGKVYSHEASAKDFEVYNQSDEPLEFLLDETKHPAYINVEMEPSVIPPKQRGVIKIVYDAEAKNDLGFMSDNVTLTTTEPADAMKSFSVYANIEEFFPPMTEEEKALAPSLVIQESVHDFGRIKLGDVVTTAFALTNSGKSMLNIRKTHTTCGCTVSKLDRNDIAPGESMDLNVSFNSTGRKGTQQKTVTIYSNDPMRPTQRVTIKAFVEE